MKKKYLLFAGNVYYPSGGFYDFIGEYENIKDALEEAQRQEGEGYCLSSKYEWWHIIDCDKMEVVKDHVGWE